MRACSGSGMERFIAEQTSVFLQSILLGVAVGALYDVFRIFRAAFRTSAVGIFFQDLLYFALVGILTFSFFLTFCKGQFRLYVLAGEAIGATVYLLSVGEIIMRFSDAIIRLIRRLLRFLYRIFIRPFVLFGGWIGDKIRCGLMKIQKKFKIWLKNRRNGLKSWCVMLYNASIFRGLSRKRRRKDGTDRNVENREVTVWQEKRRR